MNGLGIEIHGNGLYELESFCISRKEALISRPNSIEISWAESNKRVAVYDMVRTWDICAIWMQVFSKGFSVVVSKSKSN